VILYQRGDEMIRVMKRSLLVLAIISFISVIALPVKATETRCGWLQNSTLEISILETQMALGLFPGKGDIKPKEWIIFPVTKRNMSEPMVIMDMVVFV
jgi:hypothetical protein